MLIQVARREGLTEPIAVTARWDGDEASNEASWQEQVIAWIGAKNWEIIRPGTDLELLGDAATGALEAIGLIWPAPTYAFLPMIRMASGGVFVTGEGGDEAFGLWPYGRLWSDLRSHKMPKPYDLRALALGCSPAPVRRRRWRHNMPPHQHWLKDRAFTEVSRGLAREMSEEPLSWEKYQHVSRARRTTDILVDTFGRLCTMEGSRYEAPFLDMEFLAALGSWGGKLGRGDRAQVMSSLFSDLLPKSILTRRSKATFGVVFWGPASRAFAENWDGTGLNPEFVDADALRQAWLAPVPVYGCVLPLHAAWLFSVRRKLLA
jgi:asparagine synthase (glutamine-hydrolysing)